MVDRQPHLVGDPATYIGFNYNAQWPMAWWNHAGALYDAPLRMRYTGLDPQAKYRLRVVYAGDSPRVKMRLTAGDPEMANSSPYLDKPNPMAPLEFDIYPAAAIAKGELLLTWSREPGQGGNGRGTEVAEAWLLKVVEKMSRDSHGATEHLYVLTVGRKTRGPKELGAPGFRSTFNTYPVSVAP